MAQSVSNPLDSPARTLGNGYLFGVPMRDLGPIATLLIGLGTGMASFFAATFVGIAFIMIWNGGAHTKLDYSWSYMRFGLPVGIVVAVLMLSYLIVMLGKRLARR